MVRIFRKVLFLLQVAIRHRNSVKKLDALPFGKSILMALKFAKKSEPKDTEILDSLERYRRKLLQNKTEISYDAFKKGLTREVAEICDSAASPKIWAHFFYFLIKYSKSMSVLEIGTNLGVSGQYFLSALIQNAELIQKEGAFTTIEGVKGLCDIAKERFVELNPKRRITVRVYNALYDDILPQIIAENNSYEIIFIDGNHSYKPTLHYFEILLKSIDEKAIFIFDDINWNTEMQKAWKAILEKNHHTYAIDFYKLGIVIIDKTQSQRNRKKSFKLFLKF